MKTIRLALTISMLIGTLAASLPAFSAPQSPAAVVSEQTIIKELPVLEDRFFSRQYANDPTDKRLERLELLVFGATQGGTLDERYGRLKKSIAARTEAAAKISGDKPETASQYPVLNTLEWKALKKTFPSENLDQRLARVEKKLFGQESPGMPYVDRVDRLKRTLGIGVTAAMPTGPIGPAPKARPRGQSLDSFLYGDEAMLDGTNLNGAFAQMFAEMNRQMAEMDQLMRPINPRVTPMNPLAPSTPFNLRRRPQIDNMELPPYADPNSI